MNTRRLHALTLLCFWVGILSAQSFAVPPEQLQIITVQDGGYLIRTSIFLTDDISEHLYDRIYHSYTRDRLIETQGSHLGRLLHGEYQKFQEADMQLIEEGSFHYGLQDGDWKHWEGGILRKMESWQYGQRHGDYSLFDERGQLIEQGRYREGELHGKVHSYEEGELVNTVRYRKGQLLKKDQGEESDSEGTDTEAGKAVAATEAPSPRRNSRRSSKRQQEQRMEAEESNTEDVSAVISESSPPAIHVFITDGSTGQALRQVSIKVSKVDGRGQDGSFQYFGYSDEDGHYLLRKDSGDYALLITHNGYEMEQLRVYEDRPQDSYLVELQSKAVCGTLQGSVQRASLNSILSGASIQIENERGRIEKTTYSDSGGAFSVCLPCDQRYTVRVQQEGYGEYVEQIYLPPTCTERENELVAYLPRFDRPANTAPTDRPDTRIVQEETRPPSTARPVSRPAVVRDGTYAVVAGTFSKEGNAERRLSEVQAAGFSDSRIVRLSANGYFAVCVGATNDRASAEALRNQFRSTTQLSAYVRDEPF